MKYLQYGLHINYMFQWKEDIFAYENTIGYLKNHWTKHRLVCIHFDALSMPSPNMTIIFDISEFFEKNSVKMKMLCTLGRCMDVEKVNTGTYCLLHFYVQISQITSKKNVSANRSK